MCVEFHDSAKYHVLTQYDVQMGTKLQWVNRVKHFGHTFDCCANFDADIRSRKGNFIACVNTILSEFAFVPRQTEIKMCNIYAVCMRATRFLPHPIGTYHLNRLLKVRLITFVCFLLQSNSIKISGLCSFARDDKRPQSGRVLRGFAMKMALYDLNLWYMSCWEIRWMLTI